MQACLIAATALIAAASPVAALAAPPGHGGHAQHARDSHASGHEDRSSHGEMKDCCADKDGDGRMDCCDMPAPTTREADPRGAALR